MKILQVNKFYYPHRGAEKYYFDLTKLLEDHGHEVIPFATANIKNLPSQYQDYFSSNIDLSAPDYSWSSIKKIRKIIYNKGAQAEVARLIERTHPDIVHIHNIYHHLSPAILEVFKFYKLPVVMTIHDFKLICPNYLLFTHNKICERCLPHKYYNCTLHRCVKNSLGASAVATLEAYLNNFSQIYQKNIDLLIAPSQFVKNKFKQAGWNQERIAVIPHFTKIAKNPSKKAGNYILFFGALESTKGLDQLIKTLYSDRLEIDLHVAGDGPKRQYLEGLVEKYNLFYRVKFLGRLPKEKLEEEIRNCKLVVVPSVYHEVFGLAAIEAMAEGKPVLASTLGALPEIVEGQVGRLFNPDHKDSLGKSLRAILQDPGLKEMGQKAYELACEKYGPEEHYQKIIQVYNHLLNIEDEKKKE